ncbi:SpoIIE family protein phosphatase [Desulfosarcina ovata]|nr:SpoIIE family protein phosphatase [Desulfosarcina ovata]
MLRLMPSSLNQRLVLFILLPVALVLVVVGMIGFIYARDQLLNQWGEATILKLQRTAHQVDMRLSLPKTLMMMIQGMQNVDDVRYASKFILKELEEIDGVKRVALEWAAPDRQHGMTKYRSSDSEAPGRTNSTMMRMGPWQQLIRVTPPQFDTSLNAKAISLLVDINDANGSVVGQLRVVLRFDALVTAIEEKEWWQNHRAYLIDEKGKILIETGMQEKTVPQSVQLSQEILDAINREAQGTVIGNVLPPPIVTGFYRLQEAPWTLVIQAPGSEVLAPILRFRLLFFIFGGFVIAVILFLIRSSTTGTVRAIRSVSTATGAVAQGIYDVELPEGGRDEVGELIGNFSTMVDQLKERTRLKDSLNLAMEVQQQLLPKRSFCVGDICFAGICEYCDETGGDYYDFLNPELMGDGRVGITVGDVSGHGVAAALLMTTTRALVRSQVSQHVGLDEAVTHVNRLLIKDTEENGNFATLFIASFDIANHTIEWVRAGHDPALLYDPDNDQFLELGGEGVALGLTEGWEYQSKRHENWKPGQTVLIITDGVWETENPSGKQFGKARLKEIMRRLGPYVTAETIVGTIHEEVKKFRGNVSPCDDATLVAIRWRHPSGRRDS